MSPVSSRAPGGSPEPLTSAVGGVPGSQRTHLLVLYGAGQGAEFTLRAPASARVAAALRLGDAVSVGGRLLAHGLQNLHVTEALPVVWRDKKKGPTSCLLPFFSPTFSISGSF